MLRNLKSLFLVPEEKPKAKPKKTEKPVEKTTKKVKPVAHDDIESNKIDVSQPTQKVRSNFSSGSVEGVVDSKIVDRLLAAMDKNNIEGFDYLEYKKSLQALEKLPMDEATKYRSAFATAQTMGVTLDKLMETTKFYLKILNDENNKFNSTFKNQVKDKVHNRELEVKELENVIKQKSEMIKKLTTEIDAHKKSITEINLQVEQSNVKILKTENDFKKSFIHILSQIQEDVEKMEKYLK